METATTDRIIELERKLDTMSEQLDLIAGELREQRLRRQQWDELRSDLSPIAAEAMELASNELEAMQDFVQPEDMLRLLRRILRNTKNIEDGMARYESLMDFLDDAGTLTNEAFIKILTALEEFEQRGYFEFANAGLGVVDQVVTAYSKEDVEALGENVVQMLDIVKNLTQPEMLKSIDTAVKVFSNMETENVPEYSIFRVMREINKPEMKKAWGFLFTFLKNMSKINT